MSRPCPVPGCRVTSVHDAHLMCFVHWCLVPIVLRHRVAGTHRAWLRATEGVDVDAARTAQAAYDAAARAAIESVTP